MEMIKVGPVGEGRNRWWDEKGRGEVAQIFVSYNYDTVYSLQFLFYENDTLVMSNKHGTNDCESFCAVAFDYPTEFLISISGSLRASYQHNILNTIAFVTNKGSKPSIYSKMFTIQIGNYRSFGGFHGSTNSYGIGTTKKVGKNDHENLP
ncbi:hypothetical protein P3S68_023151 [Capsicum galapagoense]